MVLLQTFGLETIFPFSYFNSTAPKFNVYEVAIFLSFCKVYWIGFIVYWIGFIVYWIGFIVYWIGFIVHWIGFIVYWIGFIVYWIGFIKSSIWFQEPNTRRE